MAFAVAPFFAVAVVAIVCRGVEYTVTLDPNEVPTRGASSYKMGATFEVPAGGTATGCALILHFRAAFDGDVVQVSNGLPPATQTRYRARYNALSLPVNEDSFMEDYDIMPDDTSLFYNSRWAGKRGSRISIRVIRCVNTNLVLPPHAVVLEPFNRNTVTVAVIFYDRTVDNEKIVAVGSEIPDRVPAFLPSSQLETVLCIRSSSGSNPFWGKRKRQQKQDGELLLMPVERGGTCFTHDTGDAVNVDGFIKTDAIVRVLTSYTSKLSTFRSRTTCWAGAGDADLAKMLTGMARAVKNAEKNRHFQFVQQEENHAALADVLYNWEYIYKHKLNERQNRVERLLTLQPLAEALTLDQFQGVFPTATKHEYYAARSMPPDSSLTTLTRSRKCKDGSRTISEICTDIVRPNFYEKFSADSPHLKCTDTTASGEKVWIPVRVLTSPIARVYEEYNLKYLGSPCRLGRSAFYKCRPANVRMSVDACYCMCNDCNRFERIVRSHRAKFDVVGRWVEATTADTEEMLTRHPAKSRRSPRWRIIQFATAWVKKKGPLRLTARTFSKLDSSASRMSLRPAEVMPALLTRTSSRPKRDSICSRIA